MNNTSNAKEQPTKEDAIKMQLEIEKLTIGNRLAKGNIAKLFASIRFLKEGRLAGETNPYRIKALHAHIAHKEAEIDVEYVKIEINNFRKTILQNQLENALAQEPEPILRREQLPGRASKGAPPLMLPPDMPGTR